MMNFPERVVVTEQDIDLSYISVSTKQNILNLAESLVDYVNKHKKERRIIGFAGVSGSGKSFVAEILRQLISHECPEVSVETVTIDAFHFSNNHLVNQGLLECKGRWDTYDVVLLQKKIIQFRNGEDVLFPTYSRKLHEPISGTISFHQGPAILLLEGLWLLSDEGDWGQIRQSIDQSFYLEGDSTVMKMRTIKRHAQGGRSQEDAEKFFEHSDAINAQLVSQAKKNADVVLKLD